MLGDVECFAVARGRQFLRDAAVAHIALADARCERIPLRGRDSPGAGPHAVTATDALGGVVSNRAFRCFVHGGDGTGGDTGRIFTVHALPLGEDRAEARGRGTVIQFGLLNQHVGLGRKQLRVLKIELAVRGCCLFRRQIVPLLAGDLTGTTSDADCGVDERGAGDNCARHGSLRCLAMRAQCLPGRLWSPGFRHRDRRRQW